MSVTLGRLTNGLLDTSERTVGLNIESASCLMKLSAISLLLKQPSDLI